MAADHTMAGLRRVGFLGHQPSSASKAPLCAGHAVLGFPCRATSFGVADSTSFGASLPNYTTLFFKQSSRSLPSVSPVHAGHLALLTGS